MNPQESNRQLEEIAARAEAEIAAAGTLQELQLAKSRWLGKKSDLQDLLKALGDLPKEERPAFGQRVNDAKKRVEACVTEREAVLREAEYRRALEERRVDITMPGRRREVGALHPITRATRFMRMWASASGSRLPRGRTSTTNTTTSTPEHPGGSPRPRA
jgi:phenylalanyl-tRNA synthetase alpha chain